VALGVLVTLLGLALLPLPGSAPALAQPRADDETAAALRYVPADAALFLWADAAKLWDSPVVKSIRKADGKMFDDIAALGKLEFGLTPEDVKSVVLFLPTLKQPDDLQRLGAVVTFRKAVDNGKIAKGAEKILPKGNTVKAVPVGERSVLVLVGLGDEFAKPQPADASGPLTTVLKDAAEGKHAAVAGVTLDNLPEEIRGDVLPAAVRPFQPLFKAQTISAALDVDKNLSLDVRVKATSAGHAVDCEKALGLLLGLIQDELTEGIKMFEKEEALKDLVTLMRAAGAAAKGAKFSTLGNETRLSVSLPADLPFAAAYLAAKRKVQDAAALNVSANNLKQIALALHNYHDANGTFPPAAVCGKNAEPQLSWRVLILPYIEEDALYKEFKLDEPWDSEHNKPLLAKMPKVYSMPGQGKLINTDTYYRAFVGNGAGWEWVMGTKILSITDGTSNTIMVVTAADAVPWTKPDELNFDPDKDMTKLLGLVVNGKAQVAMFDGSVRTWAKLPPKATLNALITRAGGEVIPDFPK
jgi:prepilin-type processing-associated H-X9-DG protein